VGLSESGIDDIFNVLARWLDDPSSPLPDLRWFKYAIEDAKAYYSEALSAQPGDYAAGTVQGVFWDETRLGDALKRYYEYFAADPSLSLFARLVATRDAVDGSTGDAP
jgi:D-proline reductase (dithiol) PrdB